MGLEPNSLLSETDFATLDSVPGNARHTLCESRSAVQCTEVHSVIGRGGFLDPTLLLPVEAAVEVVLAAEAK